MFKRIKFSVRDWLGQFPAMVPVLALRSTWAHLKVRRDSAVCIEGYPRSANTFSVAAFAIANRDAGHIARHSHLAGQVIRAVRWGVPTLVLARDPEDAVLSMKIREPALSLSQLLTSYLRFYRRLERVRDRLTVAAFDEVTSDFGAVMQRMNEQQGCEFKVFTHDEAGADEAFAEVEAMFDEQDQRIGAKNHDPENRIARPSEQRANLKDELRAQLASEPLASLLQSARQQFEAFTR